MTDLLLAIGHHLLVFTMVALLAVEFTLVRPGLGGAMLARLAALDAAYGITAGLIVVVGIGRVTLGVKGAGYYVSDPWFWGKMLAFGAVVLISIPPTIAFVKWRRARGADPAFAPDAVAVTRVRRCIAIELALLPVILICAAAMARYGTF